MKWERVWLYTFYWHKIEKEVVKITETGCIIIFLNILKDETFKLLNIVPILFNKRSVWYSRWLKETIMDTLKELPLTI